MKAIRRIFVPVFALLLILGAAAAVKTQAAIESTVSGTTGMCQWVYDKDEHTITISGNGPMADYKEGKAPWYGLDIETVIVKEGVTRIGNHAFRKANSAQPVRNIILPENSLNTIGESAFEDAYITGLDLPYGLVKIEKKAFRSCPKLEWVAFPDTLKVLEGGDGKYPAMLGCFYQCKNLKSVYIPSSVTSYFPSFGWSDFRDNVSFVVHRYAEEGSYLASLTSVRYDPPLQITYDANGGKGSRRVLKIAPDSPFILPICPFEAPAGMEFDCWDVSGMGKNPVGTRYTFDQDTTLKAVWKEKSAKISFDENDDDAWGYMRAVKAPKNSTYTLPESTFQAPPGKVFNGWDKGQAGDTITVTGDITLKAQWVAENEFATLDIGGYFSIDTGSGYFSNPNAKVDNTKFTVTKNVWQRLRGGNYVDADTLTEGGTYYPCFTIVPKTGYAFKEDGVEVHFADGTVKTAIPVSDGSITVRGAAVVAAKRIRSVHVFFDDVKDELPLSYSPYVLDSSKASYDISDVTDDTWTHGVSWVDQNGDPVPADMEFYDDLHYTVRIRVKANDGYFFAWEISDPEEILYEAQIDYEDANVTVVTPGKELILEFTYGYKIKEVWIYNVTPPVHGFSPSYTIEVREDVPYYINTSFDNGTTQINGLRWDTPAGYVTAQSSLDTTISKTDTFDVAKNETDGGYRLNISLATDTPGYSFANYAKVYVNGKEADRIANWGDWCTVKCNFECVSVPPTIDAVDIVNVFPPVAGNNPYNIATTPLNVFYQIPEQGVEWYKEDGSRLYYFETFKPGKTYKIRTRVVPFASTIQFDSNVKATVNGEEAEIVGYKLSELFVEKSYTVPGGTTPGSGEEPQTDPTKIMGEDGTAFGKGASAEAVEKAITSKVIDNTDPKGTVFRDLQLRQAKVANKSIKFTWAKPAGAKKYLLYAAPCGSKNKLKKVTSTTKNSYTLKKAYGKALKKGTYYKFMVVALDKDNKVVSSSTLAHVATTGGKFTNVGSITTKAKKDKVSLKKGKSFKLGAKTKLAAAKKKVKTHRGLKYESSNTSIATVSAKGVIKAKKKGIAYIYVYAQNGIFKKIKVTVK